MIQFLNFTYNKEYYRAAVLRLIGTIEWPVMRAIGISGKRWGILFLKFDKAIDLRKEEAQAAEPREE